MTALTPELKAKFLAFRQAYEHARETMIAQDMQGALIAVKVWEIAQGAVPLTPDEMKVYKNRQSRIWDIT